MPCAWILFFFNTFSFPLPLAWQLRSFDYAAMSLTSSKLTANIHENTLPWKGLKPVPCMRIKIMDFGDCNLCHFGSLFSSSNRRESCLHC
ncbi:hypothetical protein M426DRAFT_121983 [Hypoxylon sp. CI-4A]|nr:hypothetical protein M426DRAFT_121983 [Hypoxylon sp. CI-4A]